MNYKGLDDFPYDEVFVLQVTTFEVHAIDRLVGGILSSQEGAANQQQFEVHHRGWSLRDGDLQTNQKEPISDCYIRFSPPA